MRRRAAACRRPPARCGAWPARPCRPLPLPRPTLPVPPFAYDDATPRLRPPPCSHHTGSCRAKKKEMMTGDGFVCRLSYVAMARNRFTKAATHCSQSGSASLIFASLDAFFFAFLLLLRFVCVCSALIQIPVVSVRQQDLNQRSVAEKMRYSLEAQVRYLIRRSRVLPSSESRYPQHVLHT